MTTETPGTPTPPANQPAPPARRATWRMGVRERQRLQWAVVGIICILFVIGMRPWMVTMMHTRDLTLCQTNVLKMSRGMRLYSQEWDDTLPPAEAWMDNVASDMGVTSGTGFKVSRYFQCPRDRTGRPSSYVFNTLFTSLRTTVQPEGEALERLRKLGRVDRAPMVVERHGSENGTHVPMANWDEVNATIMLPHEAPAPTGSIIRGNGAAGRLTREYLDTNRGERF